jgi:hypothetical protein
MKLHCGKSKEIFSVKSAQIIVQLLRLRYTILRESGFRRWGFWNPSAAFRV